MSDVEASQPAMGRVRVAFYYHERDRDPRSADLTWSELVKLLTEHRQGPCTLADCVGDRCPRKFGPAWSPVDIEGSRSNRNVRAVTALVADIDDCADPAEFLGRLRAEGFAGVVHSSHSHREGGPRLRLVLPLSRPVPAANWDRFLRTVLRHYGIPADPQTKDLARLYFRPSAPEGAPLIAEVFPGTRALDVDAIEALPAYAEEPEPPSLRREIHAERPQAELGPLSFRVLRATRYLARMPPSIQGQNGSGALFKAALHLTMGFLLPEEDAFQLLRDHFNPRCEPPWDEREIWRKVCESARSTSVRPGYLLDAPTSEPVIPVPGSDATPTDSTPTAKE